MDRFQNKSLIVQLLKYNCNMLLHFTEQHKRDKMIFIIMELTFKHFTIPQKNEESISEPLYLLINNI